MGERELIQAGYRYALSLAHRPEDAEDLVQTACVRLYASQGEIAVKPLLLTTIRNLFYDQRRRGKIIAFQPLGDEAESRAVEPPPRPGLRRDFEFFLGQLRVEEREAIYLHVVEGFTAAEIGRLTERPRNTVLSLIHRARKRLEAAATEESARWLKEGG